MPHPFTKEIALSVPCRFRYSICTLVTKWEEYSAMVDSFVHAGFAPEFCEYLYVDNSVGTKVDGYQGYNSFLTSAQGQYIILCHQDILLQEDRIEQLDQCVSQLDRVDPMWALLGNAGGLEPGKGALCLTDPSGRHEFNPLPVQVRSLDENFILAKRSANLCLSHDLSGFHFYGTDLCQVARAVGLNAWVINFRLYHKSAGSRNAAFYRLRQQVLDKYRAVYRPAILQTPSTVLPFARSAWANDCASFKAVYDLEKEYRRNPQVTKLERPLREAHGLDKTTYALHWLYYKLTNPFQKLRRSLAKRLRKPV